jgi:hypothetical protein
MNEKRDVIVVSAFGRGLWLASELARSHQVSVSLVDVSEQMGRWSAEDWEGPFGLLQSEALTQTQAGRLSHEDYSDRNNQGVTVWLKNGPMDFMGPITQTWLEADGPMARLKTHLSNWEQQKAPSARRVLARKWMDEPFEKTWMIHLAHQMASTVYKTNAHAVLQGSPLPLFAPWYTRRATRKGLSKALEWCASTGVQVFNKAKIRDLEFESRQFRSLELQSQEFSGALSGSQLIWMLTSLETHFIQPTRSHVFFPKGPLEPQWAWVRYRLEVNLDTYEATIPGHFIVIKDNRLPWTHDNLLIAMKVVTGGALDVWTRIPYHQRFQRSSLEPFASEIVTVFQGRLPDMSMKITAMPQEHEYAYDQLGPSLFPVYAEEGIKKLHQKFYSNVTYSGPEVWERMDWTGRFQHDEAVLKRIVDYNQVLKKKEKKRDPEIHSP